MIRRLFAFFATLSLLLGATPALASGFTQTPAVVVLCQSATQGSLTGTLSETTLATCTLPAGAMGANGLLVIKVRETLSGTAATKVLRVKFGATTVLSSTLVATATNYQHSLEISNRNNASSQFTGWDAMHNAGVAGGFTTGTAAIDTTASVTILITGQLGNVADTLNLDSRYILLYPKG